MDKSDYVKQLTQRHNALAWWVSMMRVHPGGVVPIPTAARMLSVSTNRVRQLIESGRLSVVQGMPGGNERDRFIPVDQLIDAPFAMTRGRPGVFGPMNRYTDDYRGGSDRMAGHRRTKKANELFAGHYKGIFKPGR